MKIMLILFQILNLLQELDDVIGRQWSESIPPLCDREPVGVGRWVARTWYHIIHIRSFIHSKANLAPYQPPYRTRISGRRAQAINRVGASIDPRVVRCPNDLCRWGHTGHGSMVGAVSRRLIPLQPHVIRCSLRSNITARWHGHEDRALKPPGT